MRFKISFSLSLREMTRYGYVIEGTDVTRMLAEYHDAGSLNYGEIDVPEREPWMLDRHWATRQEQSDARYTGFAFELHKATGNANARTWEIVGTLSLRGARGDFVKKMLTEDTPFRLRPRLVRNKAGQLYIYAWDMVDAE